MILFIYLQHRKPTPPSVVRDRDVVHVWGDISDMVTSEQRRPTVNQTLPEDPLDTEPVFKWFEVALCERGEDGQVIVKDIKKSLIPEYTFYEGLHPGKYYAQAARRGGSKRRYRLHRRLDRLVRVAKAHARTRE